jgi:hypothetical protein
MKSLRTSCCVIGGGPGGFQPGAAVAHVEAVVIDHGAVTEDQLWTRKVILSN